MKARHLVYAVVALTAVFLVMFWLTRYSAFDDGVSLRYEDWARGVAAEYTNELSSASWFWLILSLIGLISLLCYGVFSMMADIARHQRK